MNYNTQNAKIASITEKTLIVCCFPKASDHAVVFGCGTIGLAASITLKWLGVESVLICNYSELRLNIAKKMGFETCNMEAKDYQDKARSLWGEAYSISGQVPNIDIWLDAAGADSILDDFMKLGKVEAKYTTVAVNNNLRNIDLLRITYSSQLICGSGGYRPEDVETVMEIMKSHQWDIEKMITAEFPLEKLAEALDEASNAQKNLNVVINFGE